MKNLRDMIDAGHTLTESQQEDLLALLGRGCRAKTRTALAYRLAQPMVEWSSWGAYERIHWSPVNGFRHYNGGHDATAELRNIRNLILEG